MTTQEIRFRLTHAMTEYDRKQSKKRFYNPYALGAYFERLDDIMKDIEAGADVRQAIVAALNDRLVDACLRALNLPVTTQQEARNGSLFYKPVSSK